jgi:hypothetical protein
MDENDFDIYSIFFYDLFYNFLQLSTTLLLFASILNLSKEKAEDLYPIDTNSRFYGDGSCDIGNLRPGESSFCDGFNAKDYDQTKAGKSIFASQVAQRAKNNGFVTIDSLGVVMLWGFYLLFNCEYFAQTLLNGMQQITNALFNPVYGTSGNGSDGNIFNANLGFSLLQLGVIIGIISIINNINSNFVDPLLRQMLSVSLKNKQDIFIDIMIEIFINFLSIFILLFLFFMIPLTVFYVFAMFKILTENLTIQMNLFSIFALFLSNLLYKYK